MKNTSETVKFEKLSLDFIGYNCAELNPYGYLLRFGGGNSTREEYDPIDVSRAQFIVTACNAHDVLLDAAINAEKLLTYHWAKPEQEILDALRRAISLATTT